jgi:hypothetical protein
VLAWALAITVRATGDPVLVWTHQRLENFCQPARALSERSLSAHPG